VRPTENSNTNARTIGESTVCRFGGRASASQWARSDGRNSRDGPMRVPGISGERRSWAQNAVAVEVDKQAWCFPTKEAAAPSCEDEGKGGDSRSGFAGRGYLSRSRRQVGERADPSGARRASGRVGELELGGSRAGSLSVVYSRQ
jgi:hypothetical protein